MITRDLLTAHDTDVLRATASDLRDFAAEIIARGHDDQSITREEALLARAEHLDGLARLLPPEQAQPAHSTVTLPYLTAAIVLLARSATGPPTWEFDTDELPIDHVLLNLAMREGVAAGAGVVENLSLGRWRFTALGRYAEIVGQR